MEIFPGPAKTHFDVVAPGGTIALRHALKDAEAVHYSPETVSDTYKAQARANIGAGSAADVQELESAVQDVEAVAEKAVTEEGTSADADLDFTDAAGRVVLRLAGGHIQTKNFDSANLDESVSALDVSAAADLDITDETGRVLARLSGGHLRTKYFDSASIEVQMLASTGDTTDRTAEIVAMLTQTGVCRLGPGDFYTTGINMPDNASLIGSGVATRLILSGTGNGYAVRMHRYNTVSAMTLIGALDAITLSATVGGRHGILWLGDYSATSDAAQQPARGMIDNLYIQNFTGGGITCSNTGTPTGNHLYAENIIIETCNAGINIDYSSEFHRFTNVRVRTCYYGCINNGGNNGFTNCDFSSVKMGFVVDAALNSYGTAPNDTHGSAVNCTFNHMDNNTGVAIKIVDGRNGFMFVGCQIFYGRTIIDSSSDTKYSRGIVFSACNYGSDNCGITVNGGGVILFTGCMFQTAPTISITGNANVHFAECYVRNTGAPVTP